MTEKDRKTMEDWLIAEALAESKALHPEPPKNEGGDDAMDHAACRYFVEKSKSNMEEMGWTFPEIAEELAVQAFHAGCQHARLNPSKPEPDRCPGCNSPDKVVRNSRPGIDVPDIDCDHEWHDQEVK